LKHRAGAGLARMTDEERDSLVWPRRPHF
jgi:hypothetical protein